MMPIAMTNLPRFAQCLGRPGRHTGMISSMISTKSHSLMDTTEEAPHSKAP
jgi:hypothetical protein